MEWLNFFIGILGVILGTGATLIFSFRAFRRKNNGEATQSEADGWSRVQEVYQKTIADLQQYCENMREDRIHMREDNERMRRRQDETEDEIRSLKRDIAKQGRKVEALTPFLCGVIGCMNRRKVNIEDLNEVGGNSFHTAATTTNKNK